MKQPIVNIGKRKTTHSVNIPKKGFNKPQQKNVISYSRSVFSKRFSSKGKIE
ncbi:MAG: hypothetical protein ACE14V_16430 [bacterium]